MLDLNLISVVVIIVVAATTMVVVDIVVEEEEWEISNDDDDDDDDADVDWLRCWNDEFDERHNRKRIFACRTLKTNNSSYIYE